MLYQHLRTYQLTDKRREDNTNTVRTCYLIQGNVKEIKLTTPSNKRRKDNTNIFGTDFNVQRNVEKKRLTSNERTNVRKCPED